MRRRITLALAMVVALSGCGDEPRLGASAARAMHRDVDTVRTAAEAGDRDGALRALDALARRVERQRDGGGLSDADAVGLLERVEAAKRRVRGEIPDPMAEATATEAPSSEPGTGNDDEGNGKGKSKGKGQDKDQGQGGDD